MRDRRLLIGLVALAVAALALSTPARGQAPAPTHSGHREVAVTVRADRTVEKSTNLRVTVLSETAVKSFTVQRIPFRADLHRVDIIEAYTEKADGCKIAVEAAGIVAVDVPAAGAVAMKDMTIAFPALAVGDTIVLHSRATSRPDPSTPGYFDGFLADAMMSQSIRIETPKELKLTVAAGQGFAYSVAETETATVHTLLQRVGPFATKRPEPGAVATFAEKSPFALVAPPTSYQELGRALWSNLFADKIRVTPEIANLAQEITTGIGERRAQARAIDLWVKRNIRYHRLPVDLGGGMPNDAPGVLASRAGDCKDHAVLMSALLAAKGIASELVLINSETIYALEAAGSPAFDHMIVYLPEFGLYDDPTLSLTAFGVLAAETYDKPVLRISAAGPKLDRTPAMRADDHTVMNRTTITVAADGTISGQTAEITTGAFASYARSFATRVAAKGADKMAAEQLRLNGTPGSGRYQDSSFDMLSDPFSMRGEFKLNSALKTPGAQMIPVGLAARGRPGTFLFGTRHENRQSPFVCFAGRQVEEIEIAFEQGLPLPVAPKGRKIVNRYFSYTADAVLEGRTLRIRREFVSRVAGQVCAPEVESEIAAAMKAVAASVQMKMMLAKPTPPVTPPAEGDSLNAQP